MHASGVTELVGREEELEILLRRWSKAKAGEGQVVLLSGEAGIGKSRLTAALLERFANEPHTRIRSFCSPQHTDSALYPSICQIERAAGLTRDDGRQTKLDKLDAVLVQSSTSAEDAALFAELLSIPNDGRYPALELTPQQRRQRTLEALVKQAVALSREKPLLMIFEDAHWTDPTSLELWGRVVDRTPSLRALLIVTFRPEFEPPWIGRPYVTALTINRLAQRDVNAVIDRVVGNRFIPASIRQDIIERTDGIPLFVEEMTKAVLEAEHEGAAAQAISMVPSPVLAVPASLHASLMARLDRLGPAKEVAQAGAAIGREFSHAPLAAVARKSEAELELALGHLIKSGGQDIGAAIQSIRSLALWMLGYPASALEEAERALKAARETGHAPTLIFALSSTSHTHVCCGEYVSARAQLDECVALSEEKAAKFFEALTNAQRGCVWAVTGKASDGVQAISAGITAYRSTGATVWTTLLLSNLALAYADLEKFDDARRSVSEAITAAETTKERWFEAEINRIAGEIALKSPEPNAAKAQEYFERALAVAREQQGKSWELRAAMSLARLWRDQGKVQQARELLAPVYCWFTEGFDTRDLKEAKTLLEELAS